MEKAFGPHPTLHHNQTSMRFPLIVAISCLLLAACAGPEKKRSALLDAGFLPEQSFTINNERDTTFRSEGGVLLAFPKGCFSGAGPVRIVYREALNLADMIRGGLTTVSDGKPLSSAGMFYLAPADGNRKMQLPVDVSVPAKSADTAMRLFSGDTASGTVNWTNPQPIPVKGILAINAEGRQLFQQNCATCHAIDRALTGPALGNFKARGPWADQREVYKWIHNPAKYIPTHSYTRLLQRQYGSIMQSFPQFSNRAIDAVTLYANGSTTNISLPLEDSACRDRCARYLEALDRFWSREPAQTFESTVEGSIPEDTDTSFTVPYPSGNVMESDTLPKPYYELTIETPGWYNLDKYYHLTDSEKGHLTVTVDGDSAKQFQVYLAVVADQVLNEGELLKGKEQTWSFFYGDGSISLPKNAIVLVFAVDARHKQVRFDFRQFRYSGSHDIVLQPRTYGPEAFNQVLKALMPRGSGITLAKGEDFTTLPELPVPVVDTTGDIRNEAKLDSALQKVQEDIDRLRPRNCACGEGEFVTQVPGKMTKVVAKR
ncbi:MAG: cytochrome c [Sphingobacteriales bacterium]|nr:MAG: cytochrome c [Sphingobacteriales bacterium]